MAATTAPSSTLVAEESIIVPEVAEELVNMPEDAEELVAKPEVAEELIPEGAEEQLVVMPADAEDLTEVIVGGVYTSGGQPGGRSRDGMTSTACWGPRPESRACLRSRPIPGEPLESAKAVVEVINPLAAVVVVEVVVVALVVAVVTGVVVAAVEVVFLLTPPKLRKFSIENFNAVGKSNPPLAKICLGSRVAAVVVVVVDVAKDAVAGEELAEVNLGGVGLAEVAAEVVHLADVIAGLDDAAKDASEAAVAGVEVTEHAGGVELAVVAA